MDPTYYLASQAINKPCNKQEENDFYELHSFTSLRIIAQFIKAYCIAFSVLFNKLKERKKLPLHQPNFDTE